jgi:hypothetical protein
MPLLGLHMTVARELASDLSNARIDRERGAYYLGATTPDIRVLTRLDREATHFFVLDDFGEQSGVHTMFEREPLLKDAARLDAKTASFMTGYISHLVMDEMYIGEIYRPYFGQGAKFGDELMANVMDRLLLYHLDIQEREDQSALEEIQRALQETAANVAVDFVAREDLERWRELQIEIVTRPPSFAKMLVRQLSAAGIEGEDSVNSFMEENAEKLLHGTIERIGEDRIRQYLLDSKMRARAAMKEYLS